MFRGVFKIFYKAGAKSCGERWPCSQGCKLCCNTITWRVTCTQWEQLTFSNTYSTFVRLTD